MAYMEIDQPVQMYVSAMAGSNVFSKHPDCRKSEDMRQSIISIKSIFVVVFSPNIFCSSHFVVHTQRDHTEVRKYFVKIIFHIVLLSNSPQLKPCGT